MRPGDPWRDPKNYRSGPVAKCLGCGISCRETHWGAWCYECNVRRIDRITLALETEVLRHRIPNPDLDDLLTR